MKSTEISTVRTFRNEPRHHFSAHYKRELVEMVLAAPVSLARVAREHNLNHNQLARWRRE
jgi:transposase-like protein